nr:hypothetical protein [Streptomyces sp. SID12501]
MTENVRKCEHRTHLMMGNGLKDGDMFLKAESDNRSPQLGTMTAFSDQEKM